MYSDRGTNFVGANKLLTSAQQADRDHSTCPTWHFTSPYSPNFGGLWEASIKSVKHNLKRIVGIHKQTYKKLATVLIRIEACLNSRPLRPVTADPDDLAAPTPSPFLISDTLLAPAHCRPQNEINELILIKNDQLPPSLWKLGRITSLHPRENSLFRVVTLKTKSSSHALSPPDLMLT